jgi:hypothetical protein
MKKNALLGVLVAVIGVLAFVVVRQQKELTQLREGAAQPPVAVPPPVKHVVPVAQLGPTPELPPAPPVAQPHAAAPALAPAASQSNAPNMFAAIGKMAKDPAFKDMMRNQQKMMLDMTYGGLFKSLNLSTEDVDKLKQFLTDRQMAMMDGGMAMMSGEMSPTDRAEKAKELQQVKADYDKKIEDFLGADDYAVFKNYEDTQAERMQVNLFKQSLTGEDALTDQQEADLVAAMYQERKSLPDPNFMQKTNPDPSKFTEEGIAEMQKQLDHLRDQYLQSAANILSAPQLERFKKALDQQRAMQAMGLKMAAQMFGQQKPPPAKP